MGSSSDRVIPGHAPDSPVVRKVLALLGRIGWEAGAGKVRSELGSITDAEGGRQVAEFFQAWVAIERGQFQDADAHLQNIKDAPELLHWGRAIEAFGAIRRTDYEKAWQFLADARRTPSSDHTLESVLLHLEGTILYRRGDSRGALEKLVESKNLLSEDEFGVGRVLDTMGMIYASLGNFHAAQQFYRRSLEFKQRHHDSTGEAVSHGQLGRLHMEWGLLDSAEQHFKEDLRLCRLGDNQQGQAQMYNSLGRIALARGQYRAALDWFNAAIQRCEENPEWDVLLAYARKDLALLLLHNDHDAELDKASLELTLAEQIFKGRAEPFQEGLAHVKRAQGILHRKRKQWPQSRQCLRDALAHFRAREDKPEVALTLLESARTQIANGLAGKPAVEALSDALRVAEDSRRPEIVRAIEAELKSIDEAAYYARLFERSRGKGISVDPTSLILGIPENVTVMFLDIESSTVFTGEHDPAEVMLTLNQMMAETSEVLRKYDGQICQFRGDGFMAVFRGEYHANRAVEAGLDMNAAIESFNEPRRILKLVLFRTRVGISTGQACIGNVGTYDKLDFAAIGKATNLGARLESDARSGRPCISQATHDIIGSRFQYEDPAGREIRPKNYHPPVVRVWDVVERSSSG